MSEIFLSQAYGGCICGLSTMAHLHNLFASISLYNFRQANLSNVLKILFNFGGSLQAICQFWALMVPLDVTMNECFALSYIAIAGGFIHRTALQGFLLWRLKIVGDKKLDLWIGIVLFAARNSFHFSEFFTMRPVVLYEPEGFCWTGADAARVSVAGYLFTDLLIEIYVTTRFVQILTKANKNVSMFMSGKSKRTKRTFGFIRNIDENVGIFIKSTEISLLIILSYAITIDTEIVKIIEGGKIVPKTSNNNPRSEKTFKDTPQSPKNAHASNQNHQTSLSSSSKTLMIELFDSDTNITKEKNQGLSVKRNSSFYEWAESVTSEKFVNELDNLLLTVNKVEIIE
nr:9157_t:CDS:2 [Entrophospora candida]